MKGDAAGAASYFERVLTLRPDDVPSLVWLGNLLLDQGQTDAAERSYKRALELQPNLFAALFGLGRTALVAGRYEAGGDAARGRQRRGAAGDGRQLPAGHGVPPGRTARGGGGASTGARRRAAAAAGSVDARARRDPAESRRATRLAATGHWPRASRRRPSRRFDRRWRSRQTGARIKQKLATALAVAGDVRAAVPLYQELLAQDPNFAEAHYSLGALFARQRAARAGHRTVRRRRAPRTPAICRRACSSAHALRRARAFDRALAAYRGRAVGGSAPRRGAAGLRGHTGGRGALRHGARVAERRPTGASRSAGVRGAARARAGGGAGSRRA